MPCAEVLGAKRFDSVLVMRSLCPKDLSIKSEHEAVCASQRLTALARIVSKTG